MLRIKSYFVLLLICVVLFSLSLGTVGSEVTDKLSRVIHLKAGLDSDLFRVIETKYQGERLILIVIYGSERALNSDLVSPIKSAFRKYSGQNPLAITVLSKSKATQFHPYALRAIRGDEKLSIKNITGITEGFLEGDMPKKVPIGDETFWGSMGVVTLGEDFKVKSPFEVHYGTRSASFAALSSVQTQVASTDQSETQDTAKLSETSNEPAASNNPGNLGNNTNNQCQSNEQCQCQTSTSPSNCGQAQGSGLFLGGVGVSLLMLTLSLIF